MPKTSVDIDIDIDKQYRHSPAVTDLEEFADRGHSLTIDHDWGEVADACLAWLAKQGL
jgi:hypothetical protein